MRRSVLHLCSLIALVLGCGRRPPIDGPAFAALSTLAPPQLPPPGRDVSNRFADDPAAARLGQELFFDRGFSGRLLDADNDGTGATLGRAGETARVACAGCHVPAAGFLDTRSPDKQISLAAGWGVRKTPSLLDVAQGTLFTWDGRRDSLHAQVFAPIETPVEMNASRLFVAEELARRYRAEYEALFGPMPPFEDPARFPPVTAVSTGCRPRYGQPKPGPCDGSFSGMPGDHGVYDSLAPADQRAVDLAVINFGKAIAAYERKLSCGQSRFDRFMGGDAAALTSSEQRGASVFVGKGRCLSCHSGPYLSDHQFHDVGLGPRTVGVVFADLDDHGALVGLAAAIADPLNTRGAFSDGDDGRLPASVPSSLDGAFKTPMLRCVSQRPSFMHTAQLRTLAQVVEFFDRGGDGPGFFGTNELVPLGLAAEEKQDLVAFLRALDGPGPAPALLSPP